jgi:glycerophosphoryl diester phosphodiesterase
MKVIAHRGASAEAPENTLAAFRRAVEVRADLIELDVRFSRDRAVVVFHDRTLERTSDGTGPVASRTLREIKTLDAGSRFSPSCAGERIPLLGEVLDLIAPSSLRLFIEIKIDRGEESVREELVSAVVRLVKDYGFRSRATIASFDRECPRIARRIDQSISTGLIFADPLAGEREEAGGYEGLDILCARWNIITPAAVRAAAAVGREVYAWTIDREEELRPVVASEVNAIASNHPRWLKQALKILQP